MAGKNNYTPQNDINSMIDKIAAAIEEVDTFLACSDISDDEILAEMERFEAILSSLVL